MKSFFKKIAIGFSVFFAMLSGESHGAYCNGCDSICNGFWLDADYLYWKIKNSPEPVPLVIDQPVSGGPFTIILGDKKADLGWRSGGKFALGYWFDKGRQLGFELDYFFLSTQSKKHTVSSDENGSPRLRVPFFDVQTGLEDSSALATPGLYRGTAILKIDNRMQGAELNLLGVLPSCYRQIRWDVFAGFRWWNFDEHLKFFANSPIINPPSIYNYVDKFHVENNFYGGQIGAGIDYCYCDFFFNLKGKIALGTICQETVINGAFTTNEFTGQPETFIGGFFALPTNSGHHRKTRFSVLPELDVDIGYHFTDCFSLKVGYSVLYVSNVLWAGKQIDRKINPSQSANIDFTPTPELEGDPSPKARTKTEGLWAHGLNVRLEFQF